MTQRIRTWLTTHIYPENVWTGFLANPCCPSIHIIHIQINAQCALGTGTGTKVPRSPRTVSRSCLTLSVTPRFHHLTFLKPNGVSSMRTLVEITLMVTYHSGWVRMMVGSVHWCELKWVIWVGQITQTQHLSKDYKKSKWWCASTVPQGRSLMGKGMLLHQRDDADVDRGHSWQLGVIKDEGDWRLELS